MDHAENATPASREDGQIPMRDERERMQALGLAHSLWQHGETDEVIVARAEAFLKFLRAAG